MVYLGYFSLREQQRLQTHPQYPQKVHTPCLALEKAVDEMLNTDPFKATTTTTTTVAKTSLKKWISAVLKFIALIPSCSI